MSFHWMLDVLGDESHAASVAESIRFRRNIIVAQSVAYQ